LFNIAPGTRLPINRRTSQLSLEVEGYKARYAIDGRLPFSVEGINDPEFAGKLNQYLTTKHDEEN
jgi:hypothetical protein